MLQAGNFSIWLCSQDFFSSMVFHVFHELFDDAFDGIQAVERTPMRTSAWLRWVQVTLASLGMLSLLFALVAATYFHNVRFDLSPGDRFTLSDHGRAVLANLDTPVAVTGFIRTEDPRNIVLKDLLWQAARLTPLLTYEILDVNRNPALAGEFGVDSEVWAVTSYQQLHREALAVERENRLRGAAQPRASHVEQCLGSDPETLVVAASDYTKALPCSIRAWTPGRLVSLGTDGFGRSDGRAALRDYFEVDARHVVWATLDALERRGDIDRKTLERAMKRLEVDPRKPDPTEI